MEDRIQNCAGGCTGSAWVESRDCKSEFACAGVTVPHISVSSALIIVTEQNLAFGVTLRACMGCLLNLSLKVEA